jgi:hypothetical protein
VGVQIHCGLGGTARIGAETLARDVPSDPTLTWDSPAESECAGPKAKGLTKMRVLIAQTGGVCLVETLCFLEIRKDADSRIPSQLPRPFSLCACYGAERQLAVVLFTGRLDACEVLMGRLGRVLASDEPYIDVSELMSGTELDDWPPAALCRD